MNKHCPHCRNEIGLARKFLFYDGWHPKECPFCKRNIKIKTLGIFPSMVLLIFVFLCLYFSWVMDIHWLKIVMAIVLVLVTTVSVIVLPFVSAEKDKSK